MLLWYIESGREVSAVAVRGNMDVALSNSAGMSIYIVLCV